MDERARNSIQEIQFIPEGISTPIVIVSDNEEPEQKKYFQCDVCGIRVPSQGVLRRHMEGRRHLMKVARQGKTFECNLCDIVANSENQLHAHLRSSKHKNRILRREKSRDSIQRWTWFIIIFVAWTFLNFLQLFK